MKRRISPFPPHNRTEKARGMLREHSGNNPTCSHGSQAVQNQSQAPGEQRKMIPEQMKEEKAPLKAT